MNFKKIMLITLLLAVLIGAVSATDDIDALAVDDEGVEHVVEAPLDEDAIETAAADEDVGPGIQPQAAVVPDRREIDRRHRVGAAPALQLLEESL